ncbi:flagellar filament capping protein FliD [bacterium]|nr:flagellar filament capping protein FliD [bacterium]
MGTIQFLGLSSGTDWNSVIAQLVEIERRPIFSLINQRDQLLFEQSVMVDVNKQMLGLDIALSNLRFESTFLSRLVEASNSARVSATAEIGAPTGTFNVAVSRLAQPSRATSGINGTLFTKVANLSQTQTMGIASLTPFGNFQATRALSTTLIRDTQQAGSFGNEITAGDTITITGNLKDTTAVSGTFTFAGDQTDTLGRLATTIAQIFEGEIAGSVGSNGELFFIETDPSVAGDVTFNTTVPPLDLIFNDADFSGSTLVFGIGNNVAGAGATSRRLIHEVTFTSAGVLELSDATDLATLDQVTSGVLDAGDIFRITGTEADGSAITSTDFTYTGAAGGQTIAELVAAISGAFTSATATYENGKIVLTDNGTGGSSISMQLEFVDQGAATEFELDGFTVAEVGRDNSAQMVTTGSFTIEGTGEHLLSSTDGKAGRIRGSTTLIDPSNTVGSYGVTEFDLFTIDVDAAAGGLGPVTITGISEYSTLQDLVDAINDQVAAVTAQLVVVGGNYRLEIVGNEGGRDIRIYDVAGGILDRLISIAATDLASITDDGTNTFAATTDTDDVTMVDWFRPDGGGPLQRRIFTGDEGSSISSLIGGVAINGTGGAFTDGVATIVTTNSSELNTRQDMFTYHFGSDDIAESPPTMIPAIDPARALAEAGFAITPENASDNPLFHTDGFFTINGVQINVGDVNTVTVNEVLGAINASGAGVTAYFDEANVRFYLRSNTSGPSGITLGGGGDTSNFLTIAGLLPDAGGVAVAGQVRGNIDTALPMAQAGFSQSVSGGVFTINETMITIDVGVDTLEDVINKINSSGAGVTASYDPIADLLTLTQKLDDGTTAFRISVGDPADTSNFLESLNLTADTTVDTQIGSVRQTSLLTVNGTSYVRKSNTIDDVINKVTLSLNALTTGPESITVLTDSQRIEDAILDFLVEYNSSMELINGKPLTSQERSLTALLTEEDAANMTLQQIDDYIAERETLLTRDFISGDNAVRTISRQLQNFVTGIVQNDGPLQSLSQIGLATAGVGSGPVAVGLSLGRLLAPTSEREALRLQLNSNSILQLAIKNQGGDLHTLFANLLESRYTQQGSRDLSGGIALSGELRFTIGDGESTAEVVFGSGPHSQTAVLNIINAALNSAGLSSSMLLFYDALDQLNLRVTNKTSQAVLQLFDLSSGVDTLLGTLGWQPGSFFGPDPQVAGGIAQRTRAYVNNITGVGGIILERIKVNGAFDRQIDTYNDAISRLDESLGNFEARLRKKFERLEVALAELARQSMAMEQALAQLQAVQR